MTNNKQIKNSAKEKTPVGKWPRKLSSTSVKKTKQSETINEVPIPLPIGCYRGVLQRCNMSHRYPDSNECNECVPELCWDLTSDAKGKVSLKLAIKYERSGYAAAALDKTLHAHFDLVNGEVDRSNQFMGVMRMAFGKTVDILVSRVYDSHMRPTSVYEICRAGTLLPLENEVVVVTDMEPEATVKATVPPVKVLVPAAKVPVSSAKAPRKRK